VSKGIVFDAGGLNIKPTGYMETMYLDKCKKKNRLFIKKCDFLRWSLYCFGRLQGDYRAQIARNILNGS